MKPLSAALHLLALAIQILALMAKLANASRKDIQTYKGGMDRGDPFEAMACHGFNGLEKEVIANIAVWIPQRSKKP